MTTTKVLQVRLGRAVASVVGLLAVLGSSACSGLLDVQFPGRIPSEQIADPTLAPVLARSVVSDLECAYSNYTGANAVHSDEFETSNSNVPGSNWGERSISADEDSYVIGTCFSTGIQFGINLTLHTARFQSEDVFTRLSNWTDAEVAGRTALMAQVRAFGGYAYQFLGETFCQVAFDGADAGPPAASLALAEHRFTEAITLAQQSANTDILNMARVGLARSQLMQKKYAAAATTAALVPAGYVKNADRGGEHPRRWNRLFRLGNSLGAYTISLPYRAINDPRVLIRDTGGPSFIPAVRLWVTTKYTGLNSPIRLASYREAQLILAEAKANTGDIPGAMTILNTRRAEVGLGPLSAGNLVEATTAIIDERQKELSFEGGHRAADLLRFRLPWKGANGSTVLTNPFTARPYGATTCWPLATKETSGA